MGPAPYDPAVMEGWRRSRRTVTIAVELAVVSLLAAALAVRLTDPGTLWYFDTTKVFLPYATFFHDAIRSGQLPLWVDTMGLGYPIYAEGQIGAFYPPNAFLHLLPPVWAMEVSRIVHLALAGVGTGLVCLRLSGSRLGAIVACLGAVLGGGIVGKLEWTSVVVAYAWLPWVVLPLVRRPAPTGLGLALGGVAWGIQGLAGHPNTWVLTGIAAATLLVAIAPTPRTLGRLVALGAIATGVAAVQLLPTLQLWSLSGRTHGLNDWDLFSNSATVLDPLLPAFANAFMPLGENEWNFARQWYPGGLWGVHESSAYLGLPMIALVGIGVTRRRARPLAIVALVMVAIAVLGAFRPQLWLEAPVINGLRHPVRAYMLAGLAISVVGGIGLARLGRQRPPALAAVIPVAFLILAYLAVTLGASLASAEFSAFLAWAFGLTSEAAASYRVTAIDVLARPYPLIPELALGVGALAIVEIRARSNAARWVAPAMAVLVVVPLALFSPTINPTRPIARLSHADGPLMQAVEDVAPRRFLALIEPTWYDGIPNQLAAAGIPELGMFTSLNLHAVDAVVKDIRYPEPDPRLAAITGVDLLASFGTECPGHITRNLEGRATLCRVPDATDPPYWLPAASAGLAATSAPGAAGAVHRLLGVTVVDRTIDVEQALSDFQPVDVVSWSEGHATMHANAPAAGWVWLDRAWWPGWVTTVNGREVVPDRALGGQLVPVPAGPSAITQRFFPREVMFGAGITVGTLLALIAWSAVGVRIRPRRPQPH